MGAVVSGSILTDPTDFIVNVSTSVFRVADDACDAVALVVRNRTLPPKAFPTLRAASMVNTNPGLLGVDVPGCCTDIV